MFVHLHTFSAIIQITAGAFQRNVLSTESLELKSLSSVGTITSQLERNGAGLGVFLGILLSATLPVFVSLPSFLTGPSPV